MLHILLLSLLTRSTPAPANTSAPRPKASPGGSHAADRAPAHTADELFSLRERRRFAAYLRMRLLELREAGLDRAADAIRRRLPAGTLVPSDR